MTSFLKRWGIFIVLIAGFWSCNNKVDLLAPYKSTPVIYAALDASADTQWFRINKTYLGNGNLNDYASIKDSVEYNPDSITVVLKKFYNGNLQATWPVQHTTVLDRDTGIFYMQNVLAYYIAQPLLNDNESAEKASFELDLTANGKTYKATTNLIKINPYNITTPRGGYTNQVIALASSQGYRSLDLKWTPDVNVMRYDVRVHFIGDYVTYDGYTDSLDIPYSLGAYNIVNNSLRNPPKLSGESLYKYLFLQLNKIPGLKRVEIKSFDFVFTAANDPLSTYIQTMNPVTQVLVDQPTYSNINGALGVFGSKYTTTIHVRINDPSIVQLRSDHNNGGYCFCVNWENNLYNCNTGTEACP